MKQIGVVAQTMGDKARVKMRRHTACSNCGRCGGLHSLESPKDITVVAKNPIEAQVGDRVQLETADGGVLLAAFLVYIVPLISLFLGFGLGKWLARAWHFASGDTLGIFLGLIMLVTTFWVLKLQEPRLARWKKFTAVITKVLE